MSLRFDAAVVIALAIAVGACSGPSQTDPQDYSERAEQAFYEAEDALDDNNYTYALQLFRQVRDTYEFSPFAVMAELRLADVYFEQGTYLLAADAYRQFIQLHPSHGAVSYARFRIGMSYYEDMPSSFFVLPPPHERELGSTRLAAQMLGEFLTRYREDPDPEVQEYVVEATEAFQEALDRMAGYEFYVGTFYLERGRPIAAAQHLRTLLEEFPDSTQAPDALYLLARSYVELADVISALEAIHVLNVHFPDHELTLDALDWMARHSLAFEDHGVGGM